MASLQFISRTARQGLAWAHGEGYSAPIAPRLSATALRLCKDRDGVWNFTLNLAINIALGPSPSFYLYLKLLWTDIFQTCPFDAG